MTKAGSEDHKRLVGIRSKTTTDIIEPAKKLCEKFINKVETGRARSRETYAECKTLLRAIYEREERDADKSGG